VLVVPEAMGDVRLFSSATSAGCVGAQATNSSKNARSAAGRPGRLKRRIVLVPKGAGDFLFKFKGCLSIVRVVHLSRLTNYGHDFGYVPQIIIIALNRKQ